MTMIIFEFKHPNGFHWGDHHSPRRHLHSTGHHYQHCWRRYRVAALQGAVLHSRHRSSWGFQTAVDAGLNVEI